MITPLTHRKKNTLGFIKSQLVPPTIREIGRRYKISSPNGVICHLRALEKKGYTKRDGMKSRNVRILDEWEPAPKRVWLPYLGEVR